MTKIEKSERGRTLYHIAVDLLVIKDGKVLLGRRSNTGWNDGKWNLIGGHIENEETLEQALAREAAEELGIEISPKDIQIVHCIQHKTDRLTMQFYACVQKWTGTPKIQPEKTKDGAVIYKSDALEWFDVNNLPDEIIPSARQAITAYARKQSFSRLGF